MSNIFSRFKKEPIGFIKRGLYKTILGPIIYGRKGDYNAPRYWHDRFSKYGPSYKAVGDEGLSEQENKEMYGEAAKIFSALCQRERINFQSVRVLEIGCGTGFYTQLLHDLGVRNCVGVDITDLLFSELRKKFPQFQFIQRDISSDEIAGQFDLIVMIDVIEHIVSDSKFTFAIENIKNCLPNKGVFIVAPIDEVNKKHLFYIRSWSLEDLRRRLPGYIFGELVPFRNSQILTVRKP